ncbi:MAG: ABC transporter ATP-binding protein, partial [Burkholderiales bacterium PBB5]
LDVTIQKQILDLLADLQREHGMGLLLITHDLAVVAGMAHQVALMYAGQIIEVAPAAQFFSQPRHPYAQALLRALPDAQRRHQALEAIGGTVPPLTQSFAGCRFAPRCAHAQPACETTVPELQGPAGQQVRCLRLQAGGGGLSAPPPAADPAGDDLPQAGAATAAAKGPPLVQVAGMSVSFTLRKGLWQRQAPRFDAVRGVSFQLQAGQTLALVGESGCGKTTTGKAIVQLLRHQAVIDGQALLDGQNLFDL